MTWHVVKETRQQKEQGGGGGWTKFENWGAGNIVGISNLSPTMH